MPEGGHYELRVKGGLSPDWREWFEEFEISDAEGNETVLVGRVADSAALYGMIAKSRNLGLELVSIRRLEE